VKRFKFRGGFILPHTTPATVVTRSSSSCCARSWHWIGEMLIEIPCVKVHQLPQEATDFCYTTLHIANLRFQYSDPSFLCQSTPLVYRAWSSLIFHSNCSTVNKYLFSKFKHVHPNANPLFDRRRTSMGGWRLIRI